MWILKVLESLYGYLKIPHASIPNPFHFQQYTTTAGNDGGVYGDDGLCQSVNWWRSKGISHKCACQGVDSFWRTPGNAQVQWAVLNGAMVLPWPVFLLCLPDVCLATKKCLFIQTICHMCCTSLCKRQSNFTDTWYFVFLPFICCARREAIESSRITFLNLFISFIPCPFFCQIIAVGLSFSGLDIRLDFGGKGADLWVIQFWGTFLHESSLLLVSRREMVDKEIPVIKSSSS